MNFLRRPYRFSLRPSQSPTYYNLSNYLQAQGFVYTRWNVLAHFSEQHFQFNVSAAEQLEFKHLLALLVQEYCAEVMPETYLIDDENWPLVLNNLDTSQKQVWILKPSKLNNGQHIKIFQNLDAIERHFISANRMGGEHVLQRYIHDAHLLKGHKYSIRMFVVVTNDRGVYLYPHGYMNVSLTPYDLRDFNDLNKHLTNEHLNDDHTNVVQIPTQRLDIFHLFYAQIKNMLRKVFDALQKKEPQAFIVTKRSNLAIFGFDFMVNEALRVWLLEANHGPCFPVEDNHPLQSYLYKDFWGAFINEFVWPIVKQPYVQAPKFEKIA